MKTNDAIQEILSTPKPLPKSFKFSEKQDDNGVPFEHPKYVKKNCKQCYGRGYETLLVGSGYKEDKTKNEDRLFRRCHCVLKGYLKMVDFVNLVANTAKKAGTDEKDIDIKAIAKTSLDLFLR